MSIARRLVALLLVLMCAVVARAATINVGPGQLYTRVQAGIDAASTGDTVVVAPGIYYENIDFKGKAIVVTSSGGAAVTILDGGGVPGKSTVNFSSGEGRNSGISNFTIRGGGFEAGGMPGGGGVRVVSAAPIVASNVITANGCNNVSLTLSGALIVNNVISAAIPSATACSFPGEGMVLLSDDPTAGAPRTDMGGNTIENNHGLYAGGLYIGNVDGSTLGNNLIRNNSGGEAGGVFVANASTIDIQQNVFYGNTVTGSGAPGGLKFHAPSATVGPFNKIIASNTITDGFSLSGNLAQVLVINNVITSSSAAVAALNCEYYGASAITPPSLDHNDVFNLAGGAAYGTGCADQTGMYGNLSADPLFAGVAAGNYQLTAKSPAVDVGNNSAPALGTTDFAGGGRVLISSNAAYGTVDLGAYEYPGATDAGRTFATLSPSEFFSSANPTPAPPPLKLTVGLGSSVGQPTGNVAVYEDGVLLGVVPVGSGGTADFTPGNLVAGTHSFTAVFPAPGSGFANPAPWVTPAVSPRVLLLIPKAVTTITLSSAPNPSVYGGSVGFTVTTNASGPVTLTDTTTNTLLATLTPNGQGVATYSTAGLAGGTHQIVAAVAASSSQTGGSATVAQVVGPYPTLANNTATGTRLSGGRLLGTMTARITSALTFQPTGATGFVTFYANGTALGPPVALDVTSGTASTTFNLMQGVPYSMTCMYGGDGNYAGSTCYPEIVSSGPPYIVFPSPPATAYAATAVALTATASDGLPVTYTVVSGPATVSGSTLTYLGAGTVVVEADQPGNGSVLAAAPVQRTINVVLLTEPLTLTSNPVSTLVTFLQGGTVNNITVSTQGATGLDFNLANPGSGSSSNCVAGATYTAGQTCRVFFTFTPGHPGLRYGGIALADSSGGLLANSYLLGLGTGPQVLYAPPNQTAIGTGFGGLSGVAVDGSGNVYGADYANGGVYQISATTGATRALLPKPLTPLVDPATDVAVDGSGNVFYTTRDGLYEILAVGGAIPATPAVRTLATGFGNSINGMKVDATGNVFIASSFAGGTNSYVEEVLAVNGTIPANPVIRTLVSGVGNPTGVAVDVAGNVYFSDQGGGKVYQLVAVDGSIPAAPTLRVVSSALSQPTNLAFDVSGNLYVPDVGTHDVKELLAVNLVLPASPQVVSLGAGLSVPAGVFIDAGGSLYVADESVLQVVKLAYGSAPTLAFAATQVGQTSADSPRTVTITNGGNAPLNIPALAGGNNPAISTNFSLAAGGSCPVLAPGAAASQLQAGASCTTGVNFAPTTVGSLTGTLVRTDDNLGIPGSTQTIVLNGVGLGIPPTIVFAVGSKTFGDAPFPVSASSNSPGAFTYSVVSGPATIAGSTVTLLGAGTVTLKASQAASGNYAAGTALASFAVLKKAQTINFIPPASPVAFTSAPIALVATASSGLPVSFSVLSGPGTVSGNTLTVRGGGTIVVAADQVGDANYAAAPEVTRTVTVLYGLATVTLTGAPNPVFLRNPVTLTAVVGSPSGTPTGTVTFMEGTTVLGSAGVSGGAASVPVATLGLGSHTITAQYGGDANYAAAASNSVVIVVQDFSLTITNADVTIQHGGTAVYHIVVSSVGGAGLASTIQLQFSGGPDRSVSTLTPVTIATGSGTTEATLTMQTPNYPTGPFVLAGLLGLGLLPLRRRRGLRGLVLLVIAMVGVGALSGCGSGWKAQRFDVTVTATSGQLVRSATATLVSRP